MRMLFLFLGPVSLSHRITAVRQVEFLQECPFLHTLVLEGNPVDKLVAYRSRVIFRLQGLMLLDRNKVTRHHRK